MLEPGARQVAPPATAPKFTLPDGTLIAVFCEQDLTVMWFVEFTIAEKQADGTWRASQSQSVDGTMDPFDCLAHILQRVGFSAADSDYAKAWLAGRSAEDAAKVIYPWWLDMATAQVVRELNMEYPNLKPAVPAIGAPATDTMSLLNFLFSKSQITLDAATGKLGFKTTL